MEREATSRIIGETPARFFTQGRIEVPAVTAEQMREVDRIAREETGPNLFQMMENAGRNLALLAIALRGSTLSLSHSTLPAFSCPPRLSSNK